jgi:hypothetical protein
MVFDLPGRFEPGLNFEIGPKHRVKNFFDPLESKKRRSKEIVSKLSFR